MNQNLQKQMLIEQRITNEKKSTAVAYILLIFLGGLGIHRFYLGRTGSASAMLVLWVLGIMTLFIGVGVILLVIVGIWAFVDLFLIPGIIKQHSEALRQRLSNNIIPVADSVAAPAQA